MVKSPNPESAQAPAAKAPRPSRVARASLICQLGTSAVVTGILLSLTVAGSWAGWITIFGLVGSVLGLHMYGRTGPAKPPLPRPNHTGEQG